MYYRHIKTRFIPALKAGVSAREDTMKVAVSSGYPLDHRVLMPARTNERLRIYEEAKAKRLADRASTVKQTSVPKKEIP